MNRRGHNRATHTPNPLTSPLPTQQLTQNSIPCSAFNRTNRKQSLNHNRTALIELNPNHSRPSNSKASIPRLSSTQVNRPSQTSSQINASKWLDSEKEMMEFILSLKAKQATNHIGVTEGFEVEERKQERLSNRMLVLRKVEKYEKEAISCFYQKQHEKSLVQLQKAEMLLKKQKVESFQHSLYIQYLYSEFYFKLGQVEKWRAHQAKASQIAAKVPEKEVSSMREYLLNMQVLGICLLQHDGKHEEVVAAVDQLTEHDFSSKIRRRVNSTHIAALRALSHWHQALDLIQNECEALQQDKELNQEKKEQEIASMISLKIQVTAESGNTEKALKMVETLISFNQVSSGEKQSFTYYHHKVYHVYFDLLQRDPSLTLKRLFFTEKWAEIQPSRKQKLRLQLALFEQYYGLGLYERALELFEQISCENIVYLGPKYLGMLASIKQFQGEEKEALGIYLKLVEMAPETEKKALFAYRVLELQLEDEGPMFRQERERVLQKLLRGGGCDSVVQLYADYLSRRGQKERGSQWAARVRKTATFADEMALAY